MKIEEVYKIIAESYIEQQTLLGKFPGSYFDIRGSIREPKIFFYIPKDEKSDEFVKEMKGEK